MLWKLLASAWTRRNEPPGVVWLMGVVVGAMWAGQFTVEAQPPRRPPGDQFPAQEGMGPVPREFGPREGVPNFPGAPREGPGGPPGEMPLLEASGIIQAVGPGMIRIVTPEGQAWVLQVAPDAKVEVLGPATREVLRPGQLVRFVAEVDRRKGTVESPVESILIFTVNYSKAETQPGVFPEATGQEGPPGVAAPEGGALVPDGVRRTPPPGSGRSRMGRKPSGANGEALPPIVRLDIRGRLSGITRQGRLVVSPPPNIYLRGPIEISLADQADIRVDISQPQAYTMASPGDRVRAKGFQVGPNAGVVSEVVIELATPLGNKPDSGADRSREAGSRGGGAREPSGRARRAEDGATTPKSGGSSSVRAREEGAKESGPKESDRTDSEKERGPAGEGTEAPMGERDG
ncbi:MAG: hypothetical protein NZ899_03625 [Thermoguttaceae bacterium]|nr:hypothetical protein [Thermoguttaceae bacterium]MDW8078793.1 hypothetical protein [Thermoguttaceae bacterium]